MTEPTKAQPWACIKCNQLNNNWAVKCGRCGAPMRATQPTQAQIDAAKALVKRFEYESMALHHIQRSWLEREIAAALTAAAQVGENEEDAAFVRAAWVNDVKVLNARIENARLTSEGAQAVDADKTYWIPIAQASLAIQEETAATIEWCAQVAENFNAAGKPIADAIRALAKQEGR